MAYIANTAFEVKVSNHEFDSTANITGIFHNDSSKEEICSAGFLCVRDTVTACEGYDKVGPDSDITINNTNTWFMKKAPAGTLAQVGIYACNPFDVNMISDPATGAVYKVGSNTLGLSAPAGYPTTYTRIRFDNDHVYRFGIGNLSTEISSNKFFTITDGLLVPAAAAPEGNGTPYFELVGTGSFTQGAYAGFTYYDVRACMAVGAAAGGGGGATSYETLTNKPTINGVELTGNKTTSDLNVSYNDVTDKPQINSVELVGNKTSEDLKITPGA